MGYVIGADGTKYRYLFARLFNLDDVAGAAAGRRPGQSPSNTTPQRPKKCSHRFMIPAIPGLSSRRTGRRTSCPDSARPELVFYDQYIIGQRAIAQVILDNFSVHTSATITKVTILCSFAVVLLFALVKHNPIIACISVMFLLFGGLSYFGSLLYFAPLDFTHALVLFTALFVPFGFRRPARLVWIGATYGAAIAIFEILTGGIPTALALLALLTGISATADSLLQRFAILAFAFTVAVVTCFAIKLIAVSTVFDVNAFAVFQSALLKRIHGEIVPELAPSFVQFLAMHGIDAPRIQ